MKKRSTVLTLVIGVTFCCLSGNMKAGNPARSGQAGASELLFDPWAGTSGFAGANSACVQGIEAQFLNVAGTVAMERTEVIIGNTDYLDGAGIHVAAAGLCQPVGKGSVLGLSVVSMNVGNINITTYDNPEGGIGYFTPSLINIGLSYAHSFTDAINGGINVKLVSEAISNVHAFGVAIDAGIQYTAGAQRNIHFGIALKNVGPAMNYSGDGLAITAPMPTTPGIAGSSTGPTETVQERSQSFELPSLVNIGAAYDFHLGKDSARKSVHRITVAANFTSNSFIEDEEMLGVEYGFKSFLSIRLGYDYQQGIINDLSTNPTSGGRLTVFTGPCGGISLQYPVGKKHTVFGVSYAYRATNPYQGCHTIGIKMDL